MKTEKIMHWKKGKHFFAGSKTPSQMTLLRKTAPLFSPSPVSPLQLYDAFPTVNASYNYFSLTLSLARALLFVLFSVLKRRQNNLGPRTFRSRCLFRHFQNQIERGCSILLSHCFCLFVDVLVRDSVVKSAVSVRLYIFFCAWVLFFFFPLCFECCYCSKNKRGVTEKGMIKRLVSLERKINKWRAVTVPVFGGIYMKISIWNSGTTPVLFH